MAQRTLHRSYRDEVVSKVDRLRGRFDVEQYGALSYDPDRYPLFVVKPRHWDESKPAVLVTGGVHGYETSGVQGAIRFLETQAEAYSRDFNIVVAPCVSPWVVLRPQPWPSDPNSPDPFVASLRPTTSSGGGATAMCSLASQALLPLFRHANGTWGMGRPSSAAENRTWGKLTCAGERGSFEPPKGGGAEGSGKGALVTGQSQEASLKPLMMTHQLRREAAWKMCGIILSHICRGTSGPPQPPLSARRAHHGSPKGGGSGKEARTPPPPRKGQFPPSPGLWPAADGCSTSDVLCGLAPPDLGAT